MSTGSFFPASLAAAAFVVLGATVYPLSAARAEPSAAEALANSPLSTCLQDVAAQARGSGIAPEVIDRSLGGLSPDPDILAVATSQPEFVKPIWDYLDTTVTDARIDTGRAKLAEWAQVLDAVERTYRVDRYIVVAIWGIESSYGAVLDDPAIVKPVIRSLATLVCGEPNRAGFWREQLLAALQIVDRGEITPDRMTGSWAGAMGHTQFMPTTYGSHAVDFDGDGRRDIWGSVPDALASTANYLRAFGW